MTSDADPIPKEPMGEENRAILWTCLIIGFFVTVVLCTAFVVMYRWHVHNVEDHKNADEKQIAYTHDCLTNGGSMIEGASTSRP